jgi:metallo-beta-lactamase family protein
MASGGRILQHLQVRLPGEQNTIMFVGYQGTGTLGQNLVNQKAGSVRMFGKIVAVRATIDFMSDYSGHADYADTLKWMRKFKRKPKNTFLVHGDTEALEGLKGHIEKALAWTVTIPRTREEFDLM